MKVEQIAAQSWRASAPANLALIKYMGKQGEGNVPCNDSLSVCLPRFQVAVTLTQTDQADHWREGGPAELPAPAKQRFLDHLQWLKGQLNCQANFAIESEVSFPIACGLASSAASFAALSGCLVAAAQALDPSSPILSLAEQAELSRHGSGSSCRSFFAPWAHWSQSTIAPVDLPYQDLAHCAVIVDQQPKAVSSSEAHQLVRSSLLFAGRPERAHRRLEQLLQHLQARDWAAAHAVIWAEFWDMHALFETAMPGFGYLTPDSLAVLRAVQALWQQNGDGPWVTVDAGPNIHLLYRPDQADLMQPLLQQLAEKYQVI